MQLVQPTVVVVVAAGAGSALQGGRRGGTWRRREQSGHGIQCGATSSCSSSSTFGCLAELLVTCASRIWRRWQNVVGGHIDEGIPKGIILAGRLGQLPHVATRLMGCIAGIIGRDAFHLTDAALQRCQLLLQIHQIRNRLGGDLQRQERKLERKG